MKRYDPVFSGPKRGTRKRAAWLGMLEFRHGDYVPVRELKVWLREQHKAHTQIYPYYAGNVFVEWREKPTVFSQLLDTLDADPETPTSSDP